MHLKNIYAEGELSKESTTEEFSVVREEGERSVNRKLYFYNLDAVISIGYRVSSTRATQFRQWLQPLYANLLLLGAFLII